jgi:hypothetical protein
MKNLSLCLILFLLIVSVNDARSRKLQVQLLEIGEFHGDEVNAHTSNGWLGLFVSKKESALRSTSIRVSRVFDPIVDDGTKKITGKRVRVPQSIEPVFLVKNAPKLQSGIIKTILAEQTNLSIGESISLTLENQHYQIRFVATSNNTNPALGNAKVQIVMGGVTQILSSNLSKDEGGFSILWAGDLDGDGKLDLYVNAAPHDNVESKRLLLSSQAGKGQLIQEIARFEITGC